MTKNNKQDSESEHPEIADMKNICHVTPDTETTKDICDVVKDKKDKSADKSGPKPPKS